MGVILAGVDDAGMRIDKLLRRKMALTGLSSIYRMIRTGKVKVNGKKAKQDQRLAENDRIEIDAPNAELEAGQAASAGNASASLADTDFFRRNFKTVFEDENLIVCDKPTGLVVHSGTGHIIKDSLIDLAAAHMIRSKDKEPQPFLVHRLDRDTSGIILIAKNRRTVRMINDAIRGRRVEKTYIALCHGRPNPPTGVITAALIRDSGARDGTKVKVDKGGQRAVSRYVVEESRGNISRVKINIETGRTHQIRVHMAHISCPLVGDVRYGNEKTDADLFTGSRSELNRLYLHAHKISFFYPHVQRDVCFESEIPVEYSSLWNSLEKTVRPNVPKGGDSGKRH